MAISMDLMKKVKDVTASGLKIMEGREKGDVNSILDDTIHVNNYDFGTGQDGSEYVVFTIIDNDTEFFFGSSVVTDNFKALDNVLSEEEKEELFNTGLPIKLLEKKSKNNRRYVYGIFFPDHN